MSLQKYSFEQQLPAFLERPVRIASNNLADFFFGPLKTPTLFGIYSSALISQSLRVLYRPGTC